LATAILSLVPPWSRVMTIEDAPEIKIPIEYWTRTTIREYGEQKIGVFDLVKTSIRLSLDYIIIGEIRGEEAREWANAILLGHGAITTFHAESPESALIRLVSPPISVDPQVVNLLNVFIKTNLIEVHPGRQVYRHEVYVHEDARVKPLFIYDRVLDRIVLSAQYREKDILSELKFIEKVCNARRVSKDTLKEEYKAMINTLTSIYKEYSSLDPLLDKPSYIDLPRILYNKLYTYLTLRAKSD
ncbi:MAG: ATPase, T2SS/T4P/T4SS family, partial [Desulfurococcaceae archaeon]